MRQFHPQYYWNLYNQTDKITVNVFRMCYYFFVKYLYSGMYENIKDKISVNTLEIRAAYAAISIPVDDKKKYNNKILIYSL